MDNWGGGHWKGSGEGEWGMGGHMSGQMVNHRSGDMVNQRSRDMMNQRSGDMVNHRGRDMVNQWCGNHGHNWSSGNTVFSFNWFSLTPFPFSTHIFGTHIFSSSSFSGSGGFSHELEVLGTSSSNFRGLFNRAGGYERNNFRNCWGNRRNQSSSLWNLGSDWEIGSLNSESVDGVGDVIDSLNNAISIDILLATANISKSVP